MIKIVSRKI